MDPSMLVSAADMTKWHLGEVGETESGRGQCWGGEAGVGEVHIGQEGQVLQGGGVR